MQAEVAAFDFVTAHIKLGSIAGEALFTEHWLPVHAKKGTANCVADRIESPPCYYDTYLVRERLAIRSQVLGGCCQTHRIIIKTLPEDAIAVRARNAIGIDVLDAGDSSVGGVVQNFTGDIRFGRVILRGR